MASRQATPQDLAGTAGIRLAGLLLVAVAALPLGAQEKDRASEDVLMMDLGIIIEPDRRDSSGSHTGDSAAGEVVNLMVGKAPPGAEFIATTRELRSALDDLSGQISSLENSLNQDVEAVRLENERLRSLIRKIQTTRQEEAASKVAQRLEVQAAPGPSVASPARAGRPVYRQILEAYRAGAYQEVSHLCPELDSPALSGAQATQVAYWWADALFRLGRFDEALSRLEPVAASGGELADDAIVLEGLIYLRQGRSGEARSRFETIASQYPASEYHRLAELTIRELHVN